MYFSDDLEWIKYVTEYIPLLYESNLFSRLPTLLDDSFVSLTRRYVLSEADPAVASMKTTLSASSFSTAKWMFFVAPEPPLLTVMAWLTLKKLTQLLSDIILLCGKCGLISYIPSQNSRYLL